MFHNGSFFFKHYSTNKQLVTSERGSVYRAWQWVGAWGGYLAGEGSGEGVDGGKNRNKFF